MMTLYLTRCKPECNMQRYYLVVVAPTLLGEHSVLREWGRIGGHSRRLSPQTFATQAEALRHAWQLIKPKLKRGYRSEQPVVAALEKEVERAKRKRK